MSDEPEPRRPDILIVCDPCPGSGQDGSTFVQRFHWRDGVWIAKDTSGEKWSNVDGVSDLSSPEAIADSPAGRQHWNTRCHRCGDKVAMGDERRAQVALTRLSQSGLPMPVALPTLRRAYESTPRLS